MTAALSGDYAGFSVKGLTFLLDVAPSPMFVNSSKVTDELVSRSIGRERTRDERKAIEHHGRKMRAELDRAIADHAQTTDNFESRLDALRSAGLNP